MKKKLKIVAVMLGITLLLSSCSGSKNKESGDRDSKTLVVYSTTSEGLINATIPTFEEKYDVKVDLVQAGTGEIFAKLRNEQEAPLADVMFGGSYAQYTLNLDLFDEYVAKDNDQVIEEYQNDTGKITPYTLDGSVLIVNPEVLGDIKVDSYEDLLNPELKGKIASADPANSSSAFAHLTNMLLVKGGYESDEAWKYVEDLYTNIDGKISESSSNVYKTVADGEMAVGLSYEDPVADLVKDGANVEIVYPEEGAVFLPAGAGLIKNAKNRELAEKFMDWIISQEYQQILATTTTNRPVREDVETSDSMKEFSEINTVEEDMEYVSEHRKEMIDRYMDIFVQIQSN